MGKATNTRDRALTMAATMLDPRTGRPCHGTSANLSLNSTGRRTRRAMMWGLWHAAGLVSGGIGCCAYCGGDGTMALDGQGRTLDVTLVVAHNVPDIDGGAYCWCQTLPAHALCNRAAGDVTTFADFDVYGAHALDYARTGGLWTPREDVRGYGDDTRAVARCAVRPDGVRPVTRAGDDMVNRLIAL